MSQRPVGLLSLVIGPGVRYRRGPLREAGAGGVGHQVTEFTEGEIFSFAVSPDGASLVVAHGRTQRDIVLIEDFR